MNTIEEAKRGNKMQDFKRLSNQALIDACKDDPALWADRFCQLIKKDGPELIDEDLMICWFGLAMSAREEQAGKE